MTPSQEPQPYRLVCDVKIDAATTLGVVDAAQLRHILHAPFVHVQLAFFDK